MFNLHILFLLPVCMACGTPLQASLPQAPTSTYSHFTKRPQENMLLYLCLAVFGVVIVVLVVRRRFPDPSAAEQLRRSGMVRLQVGEAEVAELYDAVRDFFEGTPQPTKDALGSVRAVHLAGYYRTDLREQLEVRLDCAGRVCPRGLPDRLETNILRIWKRCHTLCVSTLTEAAVGVQAGPTAFTSLCESVGELPKMGRLTANSMRFCWYTTAPPASRVVCPAHTDVGLATLILRARKPGLECAPPSSDTWVDVESTAPMGSGVFIGADCLQVMTNGYFRAANHRVVHHGDGGRLSVSWHAYCYPHAVLQPSSLPAAVVGPNPVKPCRVSTVSLNKKRANAKETRLAGQAPQDLIQWSTPT